MNWPLFFGALFGPALLTLVLAETVNGDNPFSIMMGLFGGGAGGITCGVLLAVRLGTTQTARIILGIVCVPLMIVVCVVLCFFGCVGGASP